MPGMSSIVVSFAVVAMAFGGMGFGMFLRSILPEHHLSAEAKDISKVALGLVATISALVLSLMLSTAKAAYDSRSSELVQLSADILLFCRVRAAGDPEARNARFRPRAGVRETTPRSGLSEDSTTVGSNAASSNAQPNVSTQAMR